MPRSIDQPPDCAGAAALRTVFRVMDEWALGFDEGHVLLGGIGRSTYYRWRRHPEQAKLTPDTLERLSYILGMHKALRLIYSDTAVGNGWIHRPNGSPAFGGQPPLKRLLGGQVADLYVTRQALDARRSVT